MPAGDLFFVDEVLRRGTRLPRFISQWIRDPNAGRRPRRAVRDHRVFGRGVSGETQNALGLHDVVPGDCRGVRDLVYSHVSLRVARGPVRRLRGARGARRRGAKRSRRALKGCPDVVWRRFIPLVLPTPARDLRCQGRQDREVSGSAQQRQPRRHGRRERGCRAGTSGLCAAEAPGRSPEHRRDGGHRGPPAPRRRAARATRGRRRGPNAAPRTRRPAVRATTGWRRARRAGYREGGRRASEGQTLVAALAALC
mmetsp:Transcript_33484/g.103725  ORF Transcript_33484/g.103725 Transcript_33484/m.103725 type:complete len:254 (+) Transcript_33484:1693-2454(+)